MDCLQAQHKFDQLDLILGELKTDILNHANRDDESWSDLEYSLEQAEREKETAEEKVEELESELSDYREAVSKSIQFLNDFLGDITRDHPGYDVSNLEDAINKLNDI